MKKALSLLLVLVLLLSLCSCGKNDTQNTDPSTTTSQATTDNTEAPTDGTTEGTQAPTEEPTTPSTEEPTTKPTETPTTKPTETPTTKPTTCSHSYKDATCTAAKTCTKCGATSGSAFGHSYKDATCTAPKTCSKCGATSGSALGHSYKDATCTAPKTCTKCGATSGSAAGHSYSNGTCTVCGTADPNVPFEGNEWAAYIVKAGTSEQGEVLSEYVLRPTEFNGYTHKEYYSNENYSDLKDGSITHNGKTYYDYWFSSEMNGMTWTDFGDTVAVVFAYDTPIIELTLTRTGETQFTVTSSNDTASIPVGTVFEKQ